MASIERKNLVPRKSFEELFVADIPVGTAIWSDSRKVEYGTTVFGRIYDNKRDKYVLVTNVNGVVGANRLWFARSVLRK